MNRRIAFRNARLIDPATGLDARGGLLVENGKIIDAGPRLFNDAAPTDPEVIDCRGLDIQWKPANFFMCIAGDFSAQDIGDQLRAQANAQYDFPGSNCVFDRIFFCGKPGVNGFIINTHGATHYDSCIKSVRVGGGFIVIPMSGGHRKIARGKVICHAPYAFERNMLKTMNAHKKTPLL